MGELGGDGELATEGGEGAQDEARFVGAAAEEGGFVEDYPKAGTVGRRGGGIGEGDETEGLGGMQDLPGEVDLVPPDVGTVGDAIAGLVGTGQGLEGGAVVGLCRDGEAGAKSEGGEQGGDAEPCPAEGRGGESERPANSDGEGVGRGNEGKVAVVEDHAEGPA